MEVKDCLADLVEADECDGARGMVRDQAGRR
jgi:hypothetical protein